MRKIFLLGLTVFGAVLLGACNPISYFMLYEYSSAEKPDDIADRRITELERDRAERMRSNPNYRDAEIDAYQKTRGYSSTPDSIDSRPISTEELRARMEKEAKERRRR